MILQDQLLGSFETDSPIVDEIIATPEMQRLKNISLGSYYPAYPDVAHKVSRYEHSIGVYLLLKKFNASIEEQIAGLIHDVSHSAFSHTIDYILKNENIEAEKQDYQDSIHKSFVTNSEIAPILNKHGFDIEYLVNNKNFPLLDNEYPNICADRIDNGIRGAININGYDLTNIKTITNELDVVNNSFVFKSESAATLFYKLFEYGNENYWANEKSAVMFFLNKHLFRYALDKQYLTINDFYTRTDNEIIQHLKQQDDKKLELLLKNLELKNHKTFLTPKDAIFEDTINCKFRRIDPYVITQEGLKKLSELQNEVSRAFLNNTPEYLSYKLYYKALQ